MKSQYTGFTLVELAMVLLIIGLLTGGLLIPLAAQREASQRQQVQTELKQIREALLGYYLIYGHFPCPASLSSGGREHSRATNTHLCRMPHDGTTPTSHGFVPYAILGLTGSINSTSGLMEDVWGNPYRYSVSNSGHNCLCGGWIYTTPFAFPKLRERIAQENFDCGAFGTVNCTDRELSDFMPNLQICDAQDNCAASAAVVVVFSQGKNWTQTPITGSSEAKNYGVHPAISGSKHYLKANTDTRFYIGANVSTFDDIVEWISPQILFSYLAKNNQFYFINNSDE
jgi:type II secretory pathway pseudopilin PulG